MDTLIKLHQLWDARDSYEGRKWKIRALWALLLATQVWHYALTARVVAQRDAAVEGRARLLELHVKLFVQHAEAVVQRDEAVVQRDEAVVQRDFFAKYIRYLNLPPEKFAEFRQHELAQRSQ